MGLPQAEAFMALSGGFLRCLEDALRIVPVPEHVPRDVVGIHVTAPLDPLMPEYGSRQ